MRFLVVTLAPTLKKGNQYISYAPYVKEMNLWFKHCKTVTIVSPTSYQDVLLEGAFDRNDLRVIPIPWILFNTFIKALVSSLNVFIIFFKLFAEMHRADHIHIRCPGAIGLAGCIIQMLFPKKRKTAKYAGNWDPNAKQPVSYRLQKWILSNTFLTRNMQVLVYGAWQGQTKNIKPFFTASYWEEEKQALLDTSFTSPYTFLFVGSLVEGKRPLYAIQLVEKLVNNGVPAILTIYGDGVLRAKLESYVAQNSLVEYVQFKGNQSASQVKNAYKKAHFLLLASKSEGWPKVLAEAMFWGAIPLSTPVSCVSWMLDYGNRGVVLSLDLDKDSANILTLLTDKSRLLRTRKAATEWSRNYTLDRFEQEIITLL